MLVCVIRVSSSYEVGSRMKFSRMSRLKHMKTTTSRMKIILSDIWVVLQVTSWLKQIVNIVMKQEYVTMMIIPLSKFESSLSLGFSRKSSLQLFFFYSSPELLFNFSFKPSMFYPPINSLFIWSFLILKFMSVHP